MNENRNFNEDFEIEQAGPEDVGCDLFEYELPSISSMHVPICG